MCEERIATDAYEPVTGALPVRSTTALVAGPGTSSRSERGARSVARDLGLEPRLAEGSRNEVEDADQSFAFRQLARIQIALARATLMERTGIEPVTSGLQS